MTSNFDKTAQVSREPKTRTDSRGLSLSLGHRVGKKTRAGTAPALPKSDSVSGRGPGSDGLTRRVFANTHEQLVLRDAFLPTPAPGASTVDQDPPRVFAPGMRRTVTGSGACTAEHPRVSAPTVRATDTETGACTAEHPRVSAPTVRSTSARLRPHAVRSTADLANGEGAMDGAA
ncbi:MAG: hypothetical protein WAQ33_17210 [Gaiellaceae bacterium]